MKLADVIIVFFFVLACASALGSTYTSSDGAFVITASSINVQLNKVIADGKVHFKVVDKAAGTIAEADSEKIVVVRNAAGGVGLQSIKTADFSGPVRFCYTAPTSGVGKMVTKAYADNANFVGSEQRLYLKGDVKITHDDPSAFEVPAVATGDRAIVNLKKTLGPDEFRFRIESSPGLSRIEATPREKAKSKQ